MRYLGQCRCFALPPVINFHILHILCSYCCLCEVLFGNVELLIDNFRMTRNDFDEKVVHFGLYVDGGICRYRFHVGPNYNNCASDISVANPAYTKWTQCRRP